MMDERAFYASNLHFNTEMSYDDYKNKMKKRKVKSRNVLGVYDSKKLKLKKLGEM
jgi:hypothetical protein